MDSNICQPPVEALAVAAAASDGATGIVLSIWWEGFIQIFVAWKDDVFVFVCIVVRS